ncbi:MAG: glycosyltransferase [Acidimicrobiia bacterium]|nr:glycosyltransferase [Acidimicrobiia bacterium]
MPDARPEALVSVVMPCRNEERRIEAVVRRRLGQPAVLEVVVVDDASEDGTADQVAKLAVEEPRVLLVRHARRLGRGAAVRRGLAEARGDLVLVEPAVLDHEPAVDELLAPLLDGRADANYGAPAVTALPGGPAARRRSPGGGLVTRASNLVTGLGLRDVAAPKAFRREVLQSLDLEEDGVGFDAEVAAELARAGWRVLETGAAAAALTSDGAGRRAGALDVGRALWSVARYRRRRPVQPARVHEPQDFDGADDELADVLDTLEGASNYADWIVNLFVPHLGDQVLEVGAGHGTLVSRLARHAHVTASDASERCVATMARAFAKDERVTVRAFDLLMDEPTGAFDSVVMANVLEHLPDDVLALRKVHEQLLPGGAALVFVPALDALYSRFDHKIGHYRRYDRRQLAALARQAGLVVGELRYVNPVGALGWLVTVRGLGRFPNPGAVAAFDRHVVPRLEAIERRWRPPVGQSLFLAAHRPLADAAS